jgi:hypothetical protein
MGANEWEVRMKTYWAVIASAAISLMAASAQGQVAQRVVAPGTPQQRPATPMYQLLQFHFATGDDDLRGDSYVFATITLPDNSKQKCDLHGYIAKGGEGNVTWDNRSNHASAPCRLSHPTSLRDLKRSKIDVTLSQGGELAVGGADDNWNINGATVEAYDPGNPQRVKLYCLRGDPLLARLTGSVPTLTVTDLPSRC